MLQLIRKPDRDWNRSTPHTCSHRWLCYNSLENPIGIETRLCGDRSRAGDPLQLIRKPDRDWNSSSTSRDISSVSRYNSLENPIGIETGLICGAMESPPRYNSLENPIGIETDRSPRSRRRCRSLQLIRKPDRDWNVSSYGATSTMHDRYNSLENPIGIETLRI